MKRKKWLIVILSMVVVGVGLGGYFFYQKTTATASTATTNSLETAVVTRGSLKATVDSSASLAPAETVNLAFGTSGTVAEVLVKAGDVVKAGQPLARLETTDLADAVTEAEIALLQAQMTLSQTVAGPSATDLAAAESALASAKASYAETTGGPTKAEATQAELSLEQARISLESAQASYDRAGGSWRAEVNYSQIATALWEAQASYDTALASYQAVMQGATTPERQAAWAKVQQAQASLDQLKEQPSEAEVRLAELSVKKAQAALELARYNLAQATLVAPFSGTITAINIAVGDSASGTAMVLGNLQTLEVEVQLDESDVVQVAVGQLAQVTLEAFSDLVLTGTVTAIAPTADLENGVAIYPVTVVLSPTDEALIRPGMTANVTIVTAAADDALLIPVNAVQHLGERTFVLRKLREGETLTDTMQMARGSGAGFPQGGGTELTQGGGTGQPQAGSTGQMPGGLPQNGTTGQRSSFRAGQSSGLLAGFVLTPVQVGAQSDTQVAITDGLQEGDVVVVSSLTTQTGNQSFFPGGGPGFEGGGPGGGGMPPMGP